MFGMVERGMGADVEGHKVKLKGKDKQAAKDKSGGEAMWAVVLVKELWRKGVWSVAHVRVSFVNSSCRDQS